MAESKAPAPESTADRTRVGSVFVSNYPPYSFWGGGALPELRSALATAPAADAPFGLYLHIPFCRRRCKFCYFRVYTDKDSKQVSRYLDALAREVELHAEMPAFVGRRPRFVYFGGGTPSFISVRHLETLARRLQAAISWQGAEEISFECEPGTLTRPKLEALRRIGVNRLSLGVESFDDAILAENGRAHLREEIERVLPWIESVDFEQLNVDLIAGMVGETWDTWKDSVQRTIDIGPESVTIYQMELPFNTVYSQEVLGGARRMPVADWHAKQEWQAWAYEAMEAAGYRVSSAYTMVRGDRSGRFVYRDAIWHGTDLLGAGVASFSHTGGVHFQNLASWDPYLEKIEAGELPVERAFVTSAAERLTREVILQLKLGRLSTDYFRGKFGVDIRERFQAPFETLQAAGLLEMSDGDVILTREGLMQVDHLLPRFYAPEYGDTRNR